MAVNLLERLADHSLTKVSLSHERQIGSMTFVLDSTKVGEALLLLLGDVKIDTSNLRLERKLPAAMPAYPWLFCSSASVQGIGQTDREGNVGVLREATSWTKFEAPPATDTFWQHVKSLITAEFTARPYSVLSDKAVDTTILTWDKPDGTSETATDSREWKRFVDVDVRPNPEIAYITTGLLGFRTGSTAVPHGASFTGHPHQVLANSVVRVTWFFVPYKITYDQTHPMWTAIGAINQTEFLGFPAGSLLYMGAEFQRFVPPIPSFVDDPFTGNLVSSTEKFCNISYTFLRTNREGSDLPTPARANWLAAHHNLQPFAKNRTFNYVTSGNIADPATWLPNYLSFPMQLLFKVA